MSYNSLVQQSEAKVATNRPRHSSWPAPAPAPVPSSPAIIAGVDRCAVLMELTRQASEKVKAIKQWAEQDGIKDGRLGKKKSKKTSFFQKHDEEADDDDDDDKVGSTDIAKKF